MKLLAAGLSSMVVGLLAIAPIAGSAQQSRNTAQERLDVYTGTVTG